MTPDELRASVLSAHSLAAAAANRQDPGTERLYMGQITEALDTLVGMADTDALQSELADAQQRLARCLDGTLDRARLPLKARFWLESVRRADEAEAHAEALAAALSERDGELAAVQHRNVELELRVSELLTESEAYEGALRSMQQRLNAATANAASISADMDDLHERAMRAEEEKDEAKRSLADVQQRLSDTVQSLADTQAKLKSASRRGDQLKAKLDSRDKDIAAFTARISGEQERADTASAALAQATADGEWAETRIAELEATLAAERERGLVCDEEERQRAAARDGYIAEWAAKLDATEARIVELETLVRRHQDSQDDCASRQQALAVAVEEAVLTLRSAVSAILPVEVDGGH